MRIKFIYLFITVSLILVNTKAVSQSAFISNIDKKKGSFNEIVTINGKGFDNNPANIKVYFGSALAELVTASPTILEARIPANASYDHISVINTVTGTHVTSADKFLISYSGDSFDVANITAQNSNATGQRAVFDLCLCDFNQDGTSDFIVTNNNSEDGQTGEISIFSNNSTVGNIDLSRFNLSVDEIAYADCGDLNGDGKPDLILSEGGDQNVRLFILENTTSGANITFDIKQTIQTPRTAANLIRNISRIQMQDLDNNGKADIVVTNTTDNALDIFVNNSSLSDLSFNETPIQLLSEAGTNSSGLDIQDFNNDGFDDLVITTSRSSNIYFFKNTSDIGSIRFGSYNKISQSGDLTAVKSGDFNGDNFMDLMVIDGGGSGSTNANDDAHVFLNRTTSSGGNILFQKNTTIQVNGNPESLDFGDLNGDGKLDAVITSLKSDATAGLTVLINETTGSTVSFARTQISTTTTSRNIRINDIDNDGRPDIAFTHNVGANSFGDLSIFLNKNCIIPKISPSESVFICDNNPLMLEATASNGNSYKWELNINGAGFNTIQENASPKISVRDFLNINQSGEFRVTLSSESGNCSNISNSVDITVEADVVDVPVLSSNGPLCIGDELILSSNVSSTTIVYEWSGPNGFTSTDQSPTIPNFQPENAGKYELVINSGSCRGPAGSVIVGSRSLPFVQIDDDNQTFLCGSTEKTLSVTTFPGFNYQWKRDGTIIPGAITSELIITNPGSYTVVITDETDCGFETPASVIRVIDPPNASILADNEICEGQELSFSAEATGDAGLNLEFTWDFGDGNTSSGVNPFNTYDTPGNYRVLLTSFYSESNLCASIEPFDVVVRANGSAVITTPEGLDKCPGDSVRLELPDIFPDVLWSTGSTDNFIFGTTEKGQDQNTFTATYTDEVGCTGEASVIVNNFPNSNLTITSNLVITRDTITLGDGVKSVNLSVTSGTELLWEPESIIENNTSNDVTVFPSQTFNNITVSGLTSNGCRENSSVVIVDNFLLPRKTFSPNGDGQGFECWEILNASRLQNCTVYIIDSKGTIIKELDSPYEENNCIWDGTTEGRPAPEGVYYYALKCQEGDFNRTGSILLAR